MSGNRLQKTSPSRVTLFLISAGDRGLRRVPLRGREHYFSALLVLGWRNSVEFSRPSGGQKNDCACFISGWNATFSTSTSAHSNPARCIWLSRNCCVSMGCLLRWASIPLEKLHLTFITEEIGHWMLSLTGLVQKPISSICSLGKQISCRRGGRVTGFELWIDAFMDAWVPGLEQRIYWIEAERSLCNFST